MLVHRDINVYEKGIMLNRIGVPFILFNVTVVVFHSLPVLFQTDKKERKSRGDSNANLSFPGRNNTGHIKTSLNLLSDRNYY